MDDCALLCALFRYPHLSLILAFFSILAVCPYLYQRILHRGRSQQMGRPFTSSKDNLQGDQNHERIPVRFKGTKSSEGIRKSLSAQPEPNADVNLSLDSTRRATHATKNLMSSIPRGVPSILLENLHSYHYNPFLSLVSYTNFFPSTLRTTFSRHPEVYQAASIAAASLPPTYVDFCIQSNTELVGEALEKESSISSCTSFIVLATVAAASAWWRDHGLLPSQFKAYFPYSEAIESCHVSNRRTRPLFALFEPSSSRESSKMNRPPKCTNYYPGLLASVLSQNPAIYQAASVAAASLPPAYVDFSIQSNAKLVGEALEKESNISSCTSAIVLAIIAAAYNWWTVHGLFLSSQFQPNHAFNQEMARAIGCAQVHEDSTNSKENVGQTHKQKAPQIDFPEQNERNRVTQPCSALLEPSSSPDSCESSKMNRPPKSTKCALSSICGMHDENHVPGKKKHDPSSCDCNTTPSSEVGKDAGLNKKEVKGVNGEGEQGPSIVQEFRDIPGNIKSCIEGLKQCTQALEELLSHGAQPQSLSPPHQDGNLAINFGNEEVLGLPIVLNTKAYTTTCNISKPRAHRVAAKWDPKMLSLPTPRRTTPEKNNTGQEEGS